MITVDHPSNSKISTLAPVRLKTLMHRARGLSGTLLSVVILALLCQTSALAQAFPSKPITIIVPFAPGSPTDAAARAFATDFGAALGTPVVVDNRPGAGQTIAGTMVARAPADGYTLLFANLPAFVPPSIQAKLPYTGIRDFSAISDVMSIGFVLVSSASVPASNLREFIALLKADPSKYTFGSGGVASPPHAIGEMFNNQIGVKTVHVPFKGANQALLELVADRVTYAFLPTGAMEFVRNGKLRSFGVASEKRDVDFPDLPTISEAGLAGFNARAKFVLVAPKQTPSSVTTKLNAAANKVIASESFYARVRSIGGVEVQKPATPAQVASEIAQDEARWDAVVKKAGIVLE